MRILWDENLDENEMDLPNDISREASSKDKESVADPRCLMVCKDI